MQSLLKCLTLTLIVITINSCSSLFYSMSYDFSNKQQPDLLQERALFLAGKHSPGKNARLNDFAKTTMYGFYKKQIQQKWNLFAKNIAVPMEQWRTAKLANIQPDMVLYPFSGPDMPNILGIYPDAHTYIMLGLEPAGHVPDFNDINDKELVIGLLYINQSLQSFSRENFFYTNEMKINISGNPFFRGTTTTLLTFMGLMGLKPVSYRPFVITLMGDKKYLDNKDIANDQKYQQGNFSVEIEFIEPKNGKRKKLIYLSADISNNRFINKNPGIFAFFDQFNSYAVLIKAGSYLLHIANYANIKYQLLDKADFFIMDDTGPALKDLEKNWDLKVYGEYQDTIPLFKNRLQPDLKNLFARQKPEKLPFPFGYGIGSRIIIATKKK